MFWHWLSLVMVVVGCLYAVPQLMRSIHRGNSKGLSVWFLILWILDRAISLAYVSHLGDAALIIKYSIGLIFVLIIAWYKRID
jgi:uncharacterized protein with PQ loop repeat